MSPIPLAARPTLFPIFKSINRRSTIFIFSMDMPSGGFRSSKIVKRVVWEVFHQSVLLLQLSERVRNRNRKRRNKRKKSLTDVLATKLWSSGKNSNSKNTLRNEYPTEHFAILHSLEITIKVFEHHKILQTKDFEAFQVNVSFFCSHKVRQLTNLL